MSMTDELRSGQRLPTSTFRLTCLPRELQASILGHAVECASDPCVQVLQVSSVFQQWSLPYLYRRVTLSSRHALSCLLRTLRQKPDYSRYIRTLEVYSARLNWNEAVTMARIIDRAQTSARPSDRVRVLRVRFPASDIAQALDFFCHFSPVHFEWITQPCWLLRPGELFMRFLVANWGLTLRTLALGNFEYDAMSFARSITLLPGLEQLTLTGTSNRSLDPETVRTVLGNIQTAKTLRWLWVADCPQRRRTILERELGTAIPVHDSSQSINAGIHTSSEAQGDAQGRFETTAGCIKFCPRCRTQARERVMQRYEYDSSNSNDVSAIAMEPTDPSAPCDGLTQSHSDFVRARILQCMRWLP